MKIGSAFRRGLALVLENTKIIGIIFLANIVFSLVLAVPMYSLLDANLKDATTRDQLTESFDYSWWQELDFHNDGLLDTIRPSLSNGFGPLFDNIQLLLTGEFTSFGWFVLALGLVYIFLSAFFNGGAIALFSDEKRTFTIQRYFSYSGLYFNHMAALAATAVLLYYLIYTFLNPALFLVVDSLTAPILSQRVVWFANLIIYLVILFLVILINMIFDYAKIIVINEKKESSWVCIWLAVKFIFKNFGRTFGLYLLLAFLAGMLVVIGGALISAIPSNTFFLLLLTLLVQMVFIAIKIGIRLSFYAAENTMYNGRMAETRQVKKRKR